ncbi:unnamed protein product [Phytophthora fragariaefolia]|uniref:Unnamed protein product n=1 Tax=Phytophthora fragariaefolia TaxID=1490495 RepID=A0A9W6XWK3_9STRA|nr:unnamed protein product [Phytophthora fragariaefolia]
MAALIEVGDLHDRLQFDKRGALHSGGDGEGQGRSYVCSMSSTIDLGCQECGNCADLALSVQGYLSRIVEELHLISAWSSSIYHIQQQNNDFNSVSIAGSSQTDSSLAAMARLAIVTDMELMRRDMAKGQHELFQRCMTQMAYVQTEASAAISKQCTLIDELQERTNDTQHAVNQQAQSIQILEKARAENDGQFRAIATTLRQVQQQTTAYTARISELEKSIAMATAGHFTIEQELQTLRRRVESNETAHQLQFESTRRTTEDSLTALRSSNSQLSAKMQVLRLELQELSDSTQKRIQQMLKTVSSVAAGMTGKSILGPGTAMPPRRPSVVTTRTPWSSGGTAASQRSQSNGFANNFATFEDIPYGGGNTQTVMATGAEVMATSDCFIYAKAALPHRNSITDTSFSTKKHGAASAGSIRGLVSSTGGGLITAGGIEMKAPHVMTNLLTVQQSVMSIPLGFEDNTGPATVIEAPKPSRCEPIRSVGNAYDLSTQCQANVALSRDVLGLGSHILHTKSHPKLSKKDDSKRHTMSTISATHHIATPAYNYDLAASRETTSTATPSTARYGYDNRTNAWTAEEDDDVYSDEEQLPMFETCSRAIIAAAERMASLTREPRNLAVAIAYDECLDIVTAAVNHMEQIGSRGVTHENILEACRAMLSIRELLRPSPPVRRALQF